ncbi:hypothetical protein ASPFODRAFT_63238 [Aspergillus luchuensis CBS 106.47]|uniref:2-isopropylmalate synthase n=1 Tax=Aspergillus luchuensis (strain CBS 106.47) TaxID=1137211 RepID=A0A1M3T8E4_ASPLC|nr:hypothetical protein ASPFODRAFT_63238 [Aspergillus luchuensis CBS 106.47]
MPNVFTDQIEVFCRGISEREKVCVSIHSHNDRGRGVAAAEVAQMSLFGNGERTGTVDLVTLALNLYTHSISPIVNLSNLNEVVAMAEECTKIAVHPRAPYAGKYIFDIDMPRDLEIEFTQVLKAHANISGFEVTRETICRLANQAKGNRDATHVQLKISVQGSDHELEATGGDLLPTILNALRSVGYDYEVLDNQLQYIASQDTMTSLIRLGTAGNIASWGVGIHKNTDWAVSQAILVAGQKIMASQLNDYLSN